MVSSVSGSGSGSYQSLQAVMSYLNQQHPQTGDGQHPTPPTPMPGPSPAPEPPPAPGPAPSPAPGPMPMPPGSLPANLVPGGLTPTERADAVPSAKSLENLEMANNYRQDYEDAVNDNTVGEDDDQNGVQNDDGGMSSPDFYINMAMDARAYNIVENAEAAVLGPDDQSGLVPNVNPNPPPPGPAPQPGPSPTPGPQPAPPPGPSPRPNPYDPLNAAHNAANSAAATGQSPKEITANEFSQNMNGDPRAASVTDWIHQNLNNHDSAMTMRTQFQYERGATQMIGMTNGLPLPSNFMASPEYLAASGGNAKPLAGVTDPSDFFNGVSEYLSPQNAANRTVDFAVSLYPMSASYGQGGDTQSARQDYASGIGKLNDLAYSQVRSRSGSLPQQSQDSLNQTRDLVSQGLNDFVQNGSDSAKSTPGGVYDQLREYALSQRSDHAPIRSQTSPPSGVNPAVNGLGFPSLLDEQA